MKRDVLIILVLGWTAMTGPLSANYLPDAGPSPLRFQKPPVSVSNALASLPPLLMGTEEALNPSPARETAASSAYTGDLDPWAESSEKAVAHPTPETNTLTVVVEPPVPAVPTNTVMEKSFGSNGVLSAQMLMPFFSHQATNGAAKTVIVPVGFNPPPPTAPPSSTATYTKPQ